MYSYISYLYNSVMQTLETWTWLSKLCCRVFGVKLHNNLNFTMFNRYTLIVSIAHWIKNPLQSTSEHNPI